MNNTNQCRNPQCVDGWVIRASGRRVVCTACDGSGIVGDEFTNKKRYRDGMNAAMQVAQFRTPLDENPPSTFPVTEGWRAA